ncbi:hypothetical protein U0070_021872 [Myodes glareolus]|uniref:Uncharacterized protein n=1 Tax=Myodes glareolus TaxID=447135 RepID=A0AAW0H4T6_MYOGA
MLILLLSNEKEKRSARLRATFNTSTQSSSLSITAAQAADTAVTSVLQMHSVQQAPAALTHTPEFFPSPQH